MATKESSIIYYDALAGVYETKINNNLAYLKKIEEIIFSELRKRKKRTNYLDIACGDGTRAKRVITTTANISSAILLDSSPKMVKKCKDNLKDVQEKKVVLSDFLDYKSDSVFGLITTLWNVYGHIESKELRKAWLEKTYTLLEEDGIFILDINNRYNVEYGLWQVIKNILFEIFNIRNTGWFTISHEETKTNVYIHNPFELDRIIKEVGFRIKLKKYVLYRTGKISRVPVFFGQICYVLEKK